MRFRTSPLPKLSPQDDPTDTRGSHQRKRPPVALAVGVIALGAAFISAPHVNDAITLARGSLNAVCEGETGADCGPTGVAGN